MVPSTRTHGAPNSRRLGPSPSGSGRSRPSVPRAVGSREPSSGSYVSSCAGTSSRLPQTSESSTTPCSSSSMHCRSGPTPLPRLAKRRSDSCASWRNGSRGSNGAARPAAACLRLRRSRPSRRRPRFPTTSRSRAGCAAASSPSATVNGATSTICGRTRRCWTSAADVASCSGSCGKPAWRHAASTPTPTWSRTRAATGSRSSRPTWSRISKP